MKEPKLSRLRVEETETRRIRQLASQAKTIKITVNVDETSLALLKREAQATGIPYQRLLNQVLKNGLEGRATEESRLARLERQIAILNKKLAA